MTFCIDSLCVRQACVAMRVTPLRPLGNSAAAQSKRYCSASGHFQRETAACGTSSLASE
jgi:hypothetical protein